MEKHMINVYPLAPGQYVVEDLVGNQFIAYYSEMRDCWFATDWCRVPVESPIIKVYEIDWDSDIKNTEIPKISGWYITKYDFDEPLVVYFDKDDSTWYESDVERIKLHLQDLKWADLNILNKGHELGA